MNNNQEPLYLSFSQINNLISCGKKWFLSRIVEADFQASPLVFGSSLHLALAFFYNRIKEQGSKPSYEELYNNFKDEWNKVKDQNIKYGKTETHQSLENMAGKMLEGFYEQVNLKKVIAVEQEFQITLADNIILTGFVDLLEYDDISDTWILTDHKGYKAYPVLSDMSTDQIALYIWALKQSKIIPEDAKVIGQFQVLRKLSRKKEFVVLPFEVTQEDINAVLHKVTMVAKAIREELIFENKSFMCSFCQYRSSCNSLNVTELLKVTKESDKVPCIATIMTAAA